MRFGGSVNRTGGKILPAILPMYNVGNKWKELPQKQTASADNRKALRYHHGWRTNNHI